MATATMRFQIGVAWILEEVKKYLNLGPLCVDMEWPGGMHLYQFCMWKFETPIHIFKDYCAAEAVTVKVNNLASQFLGRSLIEEESKRRRE